MISEIIAYYVGRNTSRGQSDLPHLQEVDVEDAAQARLAGSIILFCAFVVVVSVLIL